MKTPVITYPLCNASDACGAILANDARQTPRDAVAALALAHQRGMWRISSRMLVICTGYTASAVEYRADTAVYQVTVG